jgi:3-hydroxybutyrate dehydrogenase
MALRLLAGRTALVTGSTSGIGRQVANAFAASGANVLLHGLIDPVGAEALSAQISSQYGVKAAVATHDVSKADELAKLVSFCCDKLGPVDILINNAGIQHVAPIEEFPKAMFDQLIAVNLTAPWLASQLVLPEMRRRHYGRIINIASVHGLVVRLVNFMHVVSYRDMTHALVCAFFRPA